MSDELREALAAIGVMADALDVADNIIAVNCGVDEPKEWRAALRKVVRARAKVSSRQALASTPGSSPPEDFGTAASGHRLELLGDRPSSPSLTTEEMVEAGARAMFPYVFREIAGAGPVEARSRAQSLTYARLCLTAALALPEEGKGGGTDA